MEVEPLPFTASVTSLPQVELLRRQYLQMLKPDKLIMPSMEELRLPQTQADIFSAMFDQNNISFMPPIRYQFRVLKKIFTALEESIVDPEEDVGLLLSCPAQTFGGTLQLIPFHQSSLLIYLVMKYRKYQRIWRLV